jgi:hypothetical protein
MGADETTAAPNGGLRAPASWLTTLCYPELGIAILGACGRGDLCKTMQAGGTLADRRMLCHVKPSQVGYVHVLRR